MSLIEQYPRFKEYYKEVYELCSDIEKVMNMFSRELAILDSNTVDYMIDEMQNTIDEQKNTIDEQKSTIDEQKSTIDEQKSTIDEQKSMIDEQKSMLMKEQEINRELLKKIQKLEQKMNE